MRFWHEKDIEPLASFVTEGRYDVWRVERRGASLSPADVGYLRSYFSETLREGAVGGFDALHYLSISRTRDPRIQDLKQDVAWVEANGGADNFIVIGYHDGGVITVSQERLPFQRSARPADWWQPS